MANLSVMRKMCQKAALWLSKWEASKIRCWHVMCLSLHVPLTEPCTPARHILVVVSVFFTVTGIPLVIEGILLHIQEIWIYCIAFVIWTTAVIDVSRQVHTVYVDLLSATDSCLNIRHYRKLSNLLLESVKREKCFQKVNALTYLVYLFWRGRSLPPGLTA